MIKKKNIAILGGSFDPPHIGHLLFARAIKEAKIYSAGSWVEFDEVRLMPCNDAEQWGKQLSYEDYRVDMVSLACKQFDRGIICCPLEITQGFEYTYQTAEYLSRDNKYCNFFFVAGPDWDYTKFKNYDKIVEDYGIKFLRYSDVPNRIDVGVRSTTIRERVRKGFPITGMVLPVVEEYIKERGLYDYYEAPLQIKRISKSRRVKAAKVNTLK